VWDDNTTFSNEQRTNSMGSTQGRGARHHKLHRWAAAYAHLLRALAPPAFLDAGSSVPGADTLACKLQIKQLVSRGANINATDYDKRSPMHLACSEGHGECTLPGHALPQLHALQMQPPKKPRPQCCNNENCVERAHIFLWKPRTHPTRPLLRPFGTRGW